MKKITPLLLIITSVIISCSQNNILKESNLPTPTVSLSNCIVSPIPSPTPTLTPTPIATMTAQNSNSYYPPDSPSPSPPIVTPSPSLGPYPFKNEYSNYPSEGYYIKGRISIVYKNSYKIRINKKEKKIDALDSNVALELSNILRQHNLLNMGDELPADPDFADLEKMHKLLSQQYNTDYPEASSKHTYIFPDETDTIKLCEELRKLPYVDAAYPVALVYISIDEMPPDTQAEVFGFVFDEKREAIENATVKIKLFDFVLDNRPRYTEIQTRANGFYSFGNIPNNLKVEILVSKKGYKPISKILITNERDEQDHDYFTGTRFDFGGGLVKFRDYPLKKI